MKLTPQPKRIIIVGGVAGGASAAAKARRVDEHAEIHALLRLIQLLIRQWGEQE